MLSFFCLQVFRGVCVCFSFQNEKATLLSDELCVKNIVLSI
jgi:hypothetical protein